MVATITFVDAIILYMKETNNFGRPTNEYEEQKLQQILTENTIMVEKAVNLNELCRLGSDVCTNNIKAGIDFYIDLANKYGIRYYGDVNLGNTDIQLSKEDTETHNTYENTKSDEVNAVDEPDYTDSKEDLVGMKPEEMIALGLRGLMENRNTMVDISETTLRNIREIFSKSEDKPVRTKYTWQGATELTEEFDDVIHGYNFEELKKALFTKKALLLRGVPGTGKTKMMRLLLHHLTGGNREKYKIISFGQSTDYTDFIGGLVSDNGKWIYKDGILTEMCKLADSDRDNNYYLGIDELSRGNTEDILGELMTCIEHRNMLVTLKNGEDFLVPDNLYIVATMNSLDGSTKKIDVATAERFFTVDVTPQWDGYEAILIRNKAVDAEAHSLLTDICKIMESVNDLILESPELGAERRIGTRAVSGIPITKQNLVLAIKNHLVPEINDRIKYCRTNRDAIEQYVDQLLEKCK